MTIFLMFQQEQVKIHFPLRSYCNVCPVIRCLKCAIPLPQGWWRDAMRLERLGSIIKSRDGWHRILVVSSLAAFETDVIIYTGDIACLGTMLLKMCSSRMFQLMHILFQLLHNVSWVGWYLGVCMCVFATSMVDNDSVSAWSSYTVGCCAA